MNKMHSNVLRFEILTVVAFDVKGNMYDMGTILHRVNQSLVHLV